MIHHLRIHRLKMLRFIRCMGVAGHAPVLISIQLMPRFNSGSGMAGTGESAGRTPSTKRKSPLGCRHRSRAAGRNRIDPGSVLRCPPTRFTRQATRRPCHELLPCRKRRRLAFASRTHDNRATPANVFARGSFSRGLLEHKAPQPMNRPSNSCHFRAIMQAHRGRTGRMSA